MHFGRLALACSFSPGLVGETRLRALGLSFAVGGLFALAGCANTSPRVSPTLSKDGINVDTSDGHAPHSHCFAFDLAINVWPCGVEGRRGSVLWSEFLFNNYFVCTRLNIL